jgi:hypothetical protein
VLFLGNKKTGWNRENLKSYYFIYPGTKCILLRINNDSMKTEEIMKYLKNYYNDFLSIEISNGILSHRGQEVNNENIGKFQSSDLFIIHNEEIPENMKYHSGQLWTCMRCKKSNDTSNALKKTMCDKYNEMKHEILYESDINLNWGSTLDKKKRDNTYGYNGKLHKIIINYNEAPADETVSFFEGSIQNVYFMGTKDQPWTNLFTSYYIIPGKKAMMIRANQCVKTDNILNELNKRINVKNPILTYKGKEVSNKSLYMYPPKSTFIIHDGSIPELYSNHLGYLWECSQCHLAKKQFRKIKSNKNDECKHTILFKDQLEKKLSWGREDEGDNIYGLPKNLKLRYIFY